MSVEVFPKAIMENSAGVQIEFGVSMSDTVSFFFTMH